MNTDSAPLTDSARKIDGALRHALAANKQVVVAQTLGISESAVSRMKDPESGELQWIARVLDAVGLGVCGQNDLMVPQCHMEALRHFAEIGVKLDTATAIEVMLR